MEKKHLALFISSLQKGGSERVLVNLAEYFHGAGYRVTIVTQYLAKNEYPISEGIARVFSEITPEETGKGRISNFYKRFHKLRGIWNKLNPDLILSFIGKNNMMAVATSRFLHIPVVVSVRGEPAMEYPGRLQRILAGLCFRFADGIVLQTKKSLSFFPEAVRKKAVILYNSLNPSFLGPPYEGVHEKRIVAVGRIDENKNHAMLLHAFAALAAEFPEHTLTIYGEGELRESLTEEAKQLGLEGRVFLPGSVEDVAAAIQRAAVFVLSSYSEGMPNTLLEAMALGLPVISTDCPIGGPGEMIKDGENGFLIAPGNTKELEECLRRLLGDEALCLTMGKQAAGIRGILHPDIINESWKVYFERLIEK